MVGNVTNLLKTIKSVEDKGQHGSFALDAAIHAIDFAIKVSFYDLERGDFGRM